ncbi:MAG: hypothetical protein R3C58_13150 [Parvularculaceae bacterium]
MVLRKLFLQTAFAALLAGAAHAESNSGEERFDSPFTVEVSAGVEYDSNVSVNEVDNNTGADDFAAVIDADVEFETKLSEETQLQFGYSFSQSLHEEFTNFDLQSHFGSAELSHDFGGFDMGAAYRLIYTRLGGDGFMLMQQFSPYFSKFFGKKLFLRADYTYTDKNFENRTDRDAKVHAGGADFYYFFNGVRTYFVLGYRYENEDATDDQFDFSSNNLKARIAQRIPFGSRDAKLKLGYRYESRDYSSITPSISAIRDDTRHRFQAELEIPLTDRLYALAEYEHAAFSSNLPSADYDQDLASLKLGVRF